MAAARRQKRRKEWDRIAIDPDIHHGEPCIKGTRVPVFIIAGCLRQGMTVAEIINEYPPLRPEDIESARLYDIVKGKHPK